MTGMDMEMFCQIRVISWRLAAVLTGLIMVCIFAPCQGKKPSLRIVAPHGRTVVRPGQKVHVTVAADGIFSSMVIMGEDPLTASRERAKPPYKFSIKVPRKDIDPGLYSLTAMGVTASGQNVDSDPVDIDVEPPDAPVTLRAEPSFLEMVVDERDQFLVFGTYADRSEARLNGSTQTTFLSEAPNIVKVGEQGMLTALAPGSTKIVVDDKLKVTVTVRERKKRDPLRHDTGASN